MNVAFGVAPLGGLPPSCGLGAVLRGCVNVSPFFLIWRVRVRGWMGIPPLRCFILRGVLPVSHSTFPGLLDALVGIRCG